VVLEERALLVGRLAEPHLVASPVDIFRFERTRGKTHESRGALEIRRGEVNEALLVAAVDAPALAGKAEGVQALIVPLQVAKMQD